MIELSEKTLQIVKVLFPNRWKEVEDLLKVECGDNIPFCKNNDKYQMERVRFAVLKLSEGKMDKLLKSIELAKIDWRDVLMAAGFGDEVDAHAKWRP